MILNENQLKQYFTRIGLRYEDYKDRELDSQLLKELSIAHSVTVPFENLDILAGKLISLKEEDLFEKIIIQRRGGNCFELNGLCAVLLRSLGFGVKDYFSRFFRDVTDGSIPMRRHRLLAVETFDGTYLWDIGIGMRSPRYPLRLVEDLVQKQCGETYKFVKEPFYGWVLYDYYKGEWCRLLSFTEEPQAIVDFVPACVWSELHPESPFNKYPIVSVKTLTGRKSLDGNTFKVFEGETLKEIYELTGAEVTKYLWQQFGLAL